MPKVFQFWEGPIPAYIRLCLETVERRYDPKERVLLSKANLEEWCPTCDRLLREDPWFAALHYPHLSDFVRVEAVMRHGGAWLDADFVMLRRLDLLWRTVEDRKCFMYLHDEWGPTNGFFMSKVGGFTVCQWWEMMHAVRRNLERNGVTSPGWTVFGNEQLRALQPVSLEPWVDAGRAHLMPVPWSQASRFFRERTASFNPRDDVWPAAFGYMLFNNTFPSWIKQAEVTRDQLLESKTMLGCLFRVALGLEGEKHVVSAGAL